MLIPFLKTAHHAISHATNAPNLKMDCEHITFVIPMPTILGRMRIQD